MKTKKIKCPITGKPAVEKSPSRHCQCCGVDISHRRPQARTCGTPCRVWLVRHG